MENLKTVDERLQRIFLKGISNSPYDFKITEGIRTLKRQQELFRLGKSKTLNSYHLKGKAVDIVVIINGKVIWDHKYYKEVAEHIKKIGSDLGHKITWGGDWKTFQDSPHFQLEE